MQFQKYDHSSKSLFKFVSNILDHERILSLPPADNLQECVNNFNTFFQKKIDDIRKSFGDNIDDITRNEMQFHGKKLSEFRPTTTDEIQEIIKESGFKTSSVDPIPSCIFKENKETFLPILCNIVNASLRSGNTDGTKTAHINPLIKGSSLDSSEFNSFRPISNLAFVGKLIERVVLLRLNEHLDDNNLHIPNQSGYKKSHSTETLLIRIVNDILIASSEQKATVVMMLDLSAAFDTVDHTILLNILKNELGITGTAWEWFKSFITGRCQKVRINNTESYEIIIKFGVPQGSVLGPVLFNIYIRSLYRTVQNLKFSIQGYADDNNVYKSFKPFDQYPILVQEIPACSQQISVWMKLYCLHINPGKTDIIVFGSQQVLNELKIKGTFLQDNICIRFSSVVKNLGFRLDESLTFRNQVTHIKSTCFTKLRSLARIRSFLNTKQMTTLVQAVIILSLDYCNSLYFGCAKSLINQLQTIQNRGCRLIFGLSKRDNVTEKMKSLHWLRIEERIIYKVLLLVFKCVHGTAPLYLIELLSFNNVNSQRKKSLHIAMNELSHPRAFQTYAPKLWHQLPDCVKSSSTVDTFKSNLKTYLFRKSYNIE